MPYRWRDDEFKTLAAALRAIAAGSSNAEQMVTAGPLYYTYNSDTGELWRFSRSGPLRMKDRRYRKAAATKPARVTEAEIAAARTRQGGWTKETLARWRVPWPPPKGWIDKLLREVEGEEDVR